ncbi:unnamed protein product [Lasius platythorax]|uniref:Uncharacterized protein n=1 Tax=Lasius platythorax TaxID=488582 RepID=A0AAV2N727_9HYME
MLMTSDSRCDSTGDYVNGRKYAPRSLSVIALHLSVTPATTTRCPREMSSSKNAPTYLPGRQNVNGLEIVARCFLRKDQNKTSERRILREITEKKNRDHSIRYQLRVIRISVV